MRTFSLLFFLMVSSFLMGQTTALTTTFTFAGIEEGYDHLCKTQVWVDGTMLGESEEVLESEGASFTVNVPYGDHTVRIINLAQYEGAWEEHTVENNYSIDCSFEELHTFDKKAAKLFLLFDIDSQTFASWKKMPKVAK
jgi:hypothetical protein